MESADSQKRFEDELDRNSFRKRIRYEREQRGWSQADLAEKIGSGIKTIGRWERGETFPTPHLLQKVIKLFGDSGAEERIDQEHQMAELEQQKAMIEIERDRLNLMQQRLEVQKRAIEYALDTAHNIVNLLQPNSDDETKAVLIRTLLPNLLQLLNENDGKQLELRWPVQDDREENVTKEEEE